MPAQPYRIVIESDRFTRTERLHIGWAARGLTAPQVARMTDRSPRTTQYHRNRVCRKAGIGPFIAALCSLIAAGEVHIEAEVEL